MEKTAESVAAALRKTAEENGHLKGILDAFGGILIEQARWKAELTDSCRHEVTPDPERFIKGVPLADRTALIRLGPLWRTAAQTFAGPNDLKDFLKLGASLEG